MKVQAVYTDQWGQSTVLASFMARNIIERGGNDIRIVCSKLSFPQQLEEKGSHCRRTHHWTTWQLGVCTHYPHWLFQTVRVPVLQTLTPPLNILHFPLVLQTLTPPLNILHFPPQWPRCTTCPMCLVAASREWPSLSGNPSSEVVCAMLMLMVWWCGVAALVSLLLLNSITLCTQAWKRSQNMEFKAQKKKAMWPLNPGNNSGKWKQTIEFQSFNIPMGTLCRH